MIALRIINLIVWAALFVYMAPGAWAALRGTYARRGDPMRLGVALTCLVICGFNLRRLFGFDSSLLYAGLYVLSCGVALYIGWLARSYGRGGRIG